jgi:hypothetical protein
VVQGTALAKGREVLRDVVALVWLCPYQAGETDHRHRLVSAQARVRCRAIPAGTNRLEIWGLMKPPRSAHNKTTESSIGSTRSLAEGVTAELTCLLRCRNTRINPKTYTQSMMYGATCALKFIQCDPLQFAYIPHLMRVKMWVAEVERIFGWAGEDDTPTRL